MWNTPQPQSAAGEVSPYALFAVPLFFIVYVCGGGYLYWLVHHSNKWSALIPFPPQVSLLILAVGVLFALLALWRGIRLLFDVRNWLSCKASLDRADANKRKLKARNGRRLSHEQEQIPPQQAEWYDSEKKRYGRLTKFVTVASVEVGLCLGVVLAALYAITVCYAAFYVEGGWQCREGKPVAHMTLSHQLTITNYTNDDNVCADLAAWHLYVPAGLKGEK